MKKSYLSYTVGTFLLLVFGGAIANPCDVPVDDLLDSFNSGNYARTVEIATEMMGDSKASQCAPLFVTRGRAFLSLGQTDDAVSDLERGVQLNPTNCMTNTFLTIGYREQGRTNIPDEGLLACIAREPRNIDARYTLASVYMTNEEFDAAADAFGEISTVAPYDVDARIFRASALRKASRYAEAKQALEEVLSSNPDSSFAHEEMGQWYFAQEEYRESIDWFGDSIELSVEAKEHPEFIADSYNSRALAWLELENIEKASRDVEESFALFEIASAYLTKAKLAFKNEDQASACRNLQKAAALNPFRKDQYEIDSLLPDCR